MADTPLYPLSFAPILKSLIWGGRRLGTILHKPIGDGDHYAESWEIADHRDDISRVTAGPLAGVSLRDLVKNRGDELLGPHHGGQFPLLVKFLDANDNLSVQVHPNDALGKTLANDNGKTEAWVIVHAEPGALIYAGLNAGVTRDTFAAAMKSGAVEPLLHKFEARPGDCILIPAGTVHAIGAGVVLTEIQQMSDATFRVFDWNRVGPDGKPRELHFEKALQATNFDAGPVNAVTPHSESVAGGTLERLTSCPYFALERLRLTGGQGVVGRNDRFTIVLGLGGNAAITYEGTTTPITFGQTLLLPASIGVCTVEPQGGEATLLTCVVP